MTHGRAQRQTVTIGGGSRDGKVAAYRLEILHWVIGAVDNPLCDPARRTVPRRTPLAE